MLKHAVLMVLLAGSIALAEEQPAATAPAVSQEGKVITDDLLKIGISDLMGPGVVTQCTRRVDGDLNVSLPLVSAVSLKDKTMADVPAAVAKAYRDGNLIPQAKVTVIRIESGTNPSMKSGPIAEGDFIRVSIVDLVGPGVESSIVSKVPEGGMVKLPEVGLVRLSKMTEAEAEKAIQVAYRKANLIPNAQVGVQRITEKEAAAEKK